MADQSETVILPPAYYEVIGALTANAATLDLVIDHMIAVFLRIDPVIGRLITDPILSTTRKIKLLKTIHDRLAQDEATKKNFKPVYQKITSAQANRSKIVHGRWGGDVAAVRGAPDAAYYIVSFVPDEEEPVTETMPLLTLQRYANEMAEAHRALEKYLHSIQLRPGKKGKHRWPPVYNLNPKTK